MTSSARLSSATATGYWYARGQGACVYELPSLWFNDRELSDSRCLYAYCSTTLYWITRRAPFGEAHSIDTGEIVDFCRETTAQDVVTVIASKPLTDNERWHPIPRASFQVFLGGVPLLGT